MTPDLKTSIAGLDLDNPTILASGILGVSKSTLKRVALGGAGAVVIKSLTLEPRGGHKNPVVVEVEGGFLNAVGYSNMGLAEAKKEFVGLDDVGVPVLASIVAEDAEGFARLAEEVSSMEFKAVEVVLSCPHTPGLGLLAGHGTPEATREITSAVSDNTSLPVFVKLSPSVMNLGELAISAQEAGADAITMGNSIGPGMVIDVVSTKPVLDFKVGGMSGPAVKPITVRCVYDIYQALEGKVPVICCGGITTGLDAVEVLMAGATAVQVGTAVYYRGIDVFERICNEITEFMDQQKYSSIKDIVGLAHKHNEHK